MKAEQYAAEARRFGTYCRDHGDNKLYRIAAGANSADYAWTETLMKQLGELGCAYRPASFMQALSFHYYTIPGTWQDKGSATEFGVDDHYRTMAQAARVDELITGHSNVMDCYDPGKNVGLVLDEWGTWWNVEPGTNPGFLYQQNSLRDALVASLHFDVFHRHADRLVMANIAQTVNVLQAMILTDPDSGALVLTPTYHVFEMNKGHQDAASLRVDLPDGLPARQVDGTELRTVSLSASRKNGQVLISLSNLDAGEAADVELDLRGGAVAIARARILTAGDLRTHNTPPTRPRRSRRARTSRSRPPRPGCACTCPPTPSSPWRRA
ncbi:alpha-L-arabinofuranosidase C-terminal domain-containing protein [Nonomuraea salmonea]|uniref:alpha-L-arabinofuranosidase C-terminal domain-containing protein n=1 Tax=Nonomuraea salmonea TaxID=46181 RepID=UPI002FEA540C